MNYTYKSIIELGKVITGKTPSTEHSEYYSGSYPFITPTDIHTFYEKYLDCTERTLSDLGSQQVRSNLLPKDSICFVCIGSTIGKMCKTKCESFTNQQINSLIPYNEYDSDYVFYYLRYIKDYFISIGGGTGSGKGIVNKTVFSKTKINIVNDKNIQKQISSVLSKYDELIEINNKRIKLLEQTAEELYKEWFVRFRFPNYKNTELENGIPKGWNYRSIKEVYNTTSGGTPSRSNESFYTGNIPWIKTGELSDCPIIQTDEYITEEAVLNSSAKILKEHSLIIAMYGATIGKLGINDMPTTCNQACCAFTPKQEALDIYYLYQYLKSNRDFLIGISNGAAQQNLSQDLLRRLKILLPPISIITQYNKIVDRLYKENVLIRKQNKNLIKQRDLLLPRLMSGKLEVK